MAESNKMKLSVTNLDRIYVVFILFCNNNNIVIIIIIIIIIIVIIINRPFQPGGFSTRSTTDKRNFYYMNCLHSFRTGKNM